MEDLLFSNIGGRIKTVAKVTAYIEMGSAVLGGVIMFFAALSDMGELWFLLLLIPVIVMIGCFVAWLSSILLYGFGELIETNSEIRDKTAYLARVTMEDKNKKSAPEDVSRYVGTYGRFDAPLTSATPVTRATPATQAAPVAQPVPQGYPQARPNARDQAQQTAQMYNRYDAPRPAAPVQPAVPGAKDSLAEKLAFALRYQTDDGMIHYLEQFPDERIEQILKNPKERIREIVQRVLDTM